MKTALFILLCVFVFSCESGKTRTVSLSQPKQILSEGYVIPNDRLLKPSVVPLDKSEIDLLKVGVPAVLPAHANVFPPESITKVKASAPRIGTPGKGIFELPKVDPATGKPFTARHSKPVAALPPRMKDAASLDIQYLDVEQGLNSSYVRAIFEDSRGNIWLGTEVGVSRYEGKTLVHFTHSEGLGHNTVRCVMEDKSGNLWFGTDKGVTRYDGKLMTNFASAEGFVDETVYEIVEDNSGNLWFATADGAVMYDGESFSHYGKKQGINSEIVNGVSKDDAGNIWFATSDGVTKFDGKTFYNYNEDQGFIDSYAMTVMADKAGTIWIGTDDGVYTFDGNYFTCVIRSESVPNGRFHSIVTDHEGNIWFGTDGGGAIKYDGKNFTQFTEAEGLSNNTVLTIFKDRSDNLWFGTDGGGVSIYDPKSFVHYNERQGLCGNYILSVLEDRRGNLWFGSYLEGVSKYDGKSFTNYTENEGLPSNTVRTIFEDDSGNLWFGTSEGVSKYDGSTFTNYSVSAGMTSRYIRSIAADDLGNMWFGSHSDGVDKFDGKSFTHYSTKEGLSGNGVGCIYNDKSGKLWFGTDGGISCYDGKTFTQFTEKEGLSNNVIWSIFEDSRGNLWFGTDGGGLSKYDGKRFTHYNKNQGLCRNFVFCMEEDSRGNLWVGTDRGLCCLTSDFIESPSDRRPVNFHKEDGLKAEDFFQGAAVIDRKNRLWLGSGKALTMLDLNKMEFDAGVPEMQLDQIFLQENYVDYHSTTRHKSRSTGGGRKQLRYIRYKDVAPFYNRPIDLELPYNLDHVTFQFSAIDWYAPHKIQYQYKIEGLDEDWSSLTPDNKADYRNIPHGSYIFKVKAIGSAGKWSQTVSYSFIVHPPWWLTWWAYTIYAILTALAIVCIVRWNSQLLRKRAILLKQKVAEATQEIKEQKAVVEEQKQAIEERHKEITDSINYAERIQRSLLASQKLLDENLPDYFILFKPKDVVSGDFYWATRLADDNFVLMCGDSTGHGVPGAIMSILNIACLEKAVEVERLKMPDEILNYTRCKIIETLKNDGSEEGGKDGMDGTLLSFDFANNMLHFASANNPLWLVRGEEFIEVKPDRFPVGKYDRDYEPFTLQTLSLQKGDVVYALTDGFSDQFGGPDQHQGGKKFTHKKLRELLLLLSNHPMERQKQQLNDIFEDWKGTLEQVDDVTIIGIRV